MKRTAVDYSYTRYIRGGAVRHDTRFLCHTARKQASPPSAASVKFEDFLPPLGAQADDDEYDGVPIGTRPEGASSESRGPLGSE
jgi:hypothetical protein